MGAPSVHKGFSLTPMLAALSVAAVVGVLSIPTYHAYLEQRHVARAIADLGRISLEIEKYRLRHAGAIPTDLATIGFVNPLDPWGNPFRFEVVDEQIRGSTIRVGDRIPLNSDYDLFSHGPDGHSGVDLLAPESRDNIVRALDGGFFGMATDLMTVDVVAFR